jgi:hypothetical protein
VRLAVAATIAVALLTAGFWVERKAVSCGAGLVDARLPYNLRADWFNGGFWLTDAEGWGVLAPPGEVELRNGQMLAVDRVARYTRMRGFVVEVATPSGGKVLISFDGSTGTPLRPRLLELKPKGLNELVERSSWISVDPGSCLYGRFGTARAFVAIGLLILIAAELRPNAQ